MESDQVENVTTNTDDIPLSIRQRRSHTLKSTSKSFPKRDRNIRKMKTTINSLRCKIYRRKVQHCFCKGKPLISSNKGTKGTILKLIKESKSFLSKEAHIVFSNELRANFINKRNRRYDDNLREMCLLWYYASPKHIRQ
ncbi:uncharacterized protein LOC123320524 [Coccinella septempunctata]|uniref:uncharacterized protein LOC123320524 n=1 Tax=Coccinella septempunctata TaxID=41139 RepID=UPI001D099D71|nr:uncharacterized protein LOC123320524 [Coccinella septempunctata]